MKKFLFYILGLSLLAFFGNEGGFKLYKLYHFAQSIEQKNKTIDNDNRRIREEIVLLKDSAYLENYIRRTLGFVKENEKVYEFKEEP